MNHNNINEVEGGEEVVSWEEFIPKIVVRVLLVEPDYSTRQILTALLRKCNYKVAAISDGLQAWEILKKRHDSIDLILTEFDLPSISGYALLSLIAQHDTCKTIPVIVTSSQDCVSMVLKCMLKGASDFLIKPVRKNELKNLWRHVWRRLSINEGHDIQNLATDQQHNISSGDNVSTSVSLPLRKSVKSEPCGQSSDENNVSVTLREVDNGSGSSTGLGTEYESVDCTNNGVLLSEEPVNCQGALDLISSLNNPLCSNTESSNLINIAELDLSLRRNYDCETEELDDRHALYHSEDSTFSLYKSNDTTQSSCPISTSELTDVKWVTESSPQPKTLNIITDDKPTGTFSSTINNSSSQAGDELRNRDSVEPQYSNSTVRTEFVDQKISECRSGSDLTDSNTNGADMAGISATVKVEADPIRKRSSHHSAEREAALARFRLKRKERCFDKKVRYQSRKKRADERPRVKGQYVRQLPAGN